MILYRISTALHLPPPFLASEIRGLPAQPFSLLASGGRSVAVGPSDFRRLSYPACFLVSRRGHSLTCHSIIRSLFGSEYALKTIGGPKYALQVSLDRGSKEARKCNHATYALLLSLPLRFYGVWFAFYPTVVIDPPPEES